MTYGREKVGLKKLSFLNQKMTDFSKFEEGDENKFLVGCYHDSTDSHSGSGQTLGREIENFMKNLERG